MNNFNMLNGNKIVALGTVLIGLLLFCLPAHGQPDISTLRSRESAPSLQLHATQDNKGTQPSHTFSMGGHWIGMLAPGKQLYPAYIADPVYPRTAMNAATYRNSEIPNAGDQRFVFRIGGRLGLLRISPVDNWDEGIQLNLNGAFLGMFDRDHSQDNIGWDGLYGIELNWQKSARLSFKAGINHDSSHVGDEFAERTGIRRINYTRQEYVLGVRFSGWENVSVYSEAGWAFDLRNEDFQKAWRIQTGLEFVDDDCLWKGQMGYYAAMDLTSFEESDWKPDVTVQTGLVVPVYRINRTFRMGVEYRDGRSLIGEFARYEETYWTFGLWIDL